MLRIAELSGGNPFTALELARAFGGEGFEEHLDALPSGGAIDLARSRIGELAAPIREAVELASVPRSPTIDLLRRLAPAASDLRSVLARAERAGVLALEGDRIRFAHPILAAAAYDSIPPDRRMDLHRAVALLSDDLEERARHLAAAAEHPDAEVAMALEGAAEQAWRRGAPDAAARLQGMACRLTPPDDEEALALRRVAHGRLLHSAGDAPGAIEELRSVVGSLPLGVIRARALYHLMYVTRLSGALGRAVEYGLQAAHEATDDPTLQAEVYELLSRLSDDDVERKLDTARKGSAAIERLPDPDPEVVFYVRAALVEAEFYAGLGIDLERLEGLAPEAKPRFPPVRTASRGDDLIGRLLAYDGQIDKGLSVLRGMYERASVESRSIMPAILGWMAEAETMAGRFAQAAALAREAIERAEETGTVGGNPWEVGFHAVALAQLGYLDDAESTATRIVETAEEDPFVGPDQWPARLALGVAAMARGRPGDAAAHLSILDRSKREAGIREPRLCAHAGELVEALIGTGALEDATGALARLEEDAERSDGRWSRGVAARFRALLYAVERRSDEALDAAERSLLELDGVPAPFERARTLLVTGQIRRRRKEKGPARDAPSGARDVRGARDADLGRTRQSRVGPDTRAGLGDRTHTDRGADRPTRRRRIDEQGDRRSNVPQPEDRRGESHARLPQARRSLPHRARRPIRRGASSRRTVGEPLIPRRGGAPTFGHVTGTVDAGFVAECYWAGVGPEDLRSLDERVSSCASELTRTGERVRYLGSMLIVEDEVVLCLFEGSATAVRSVAERAAIPFGRILRGNGAPWSKERSSHDAAQARRRYS